MLNIIWMLFTGLFIGLGAAWFTRKRGISSWIINIVSGLVGAFLGEVLIFHWNVYIFEIAVLPSLVGAILIVATVNGLRYLMRIS